MKKVSLKVATCLVAGAFLFNSCIGSYSLFNKYAQWELRMTNSKFLNAIIGFVIDIVCVPITLLVDHLVLNTIEFWSGDNPVSSNVGKTQEVIGEDGKMYTVKTLKDGYEVTDSEGAVTLFTHNKKDNSWSMTKNGVTQELFRFNPDGKSITTVLNGEEKSFTLNEQGVFEARMAAGDGLFFAAR